MGFFKTVLAGMILTPPMIGGTLTAINKFVSPYKKLSPDFKLLLSVGIGTVGAYAVSDLLSCECDCKKKKKIKKEKKDS